MPKYSSKPLDAFALHNLSHTMKGPAAYSPHRDAVRKRILKTWPEGDGAQIKGDSPVFSEVREFEISPEEQTAMGEGLWGIYADPESNDGMRKLCLEQAKLLKVSGAFTKRIAEQKVEKLMESDDAIKGDEDASQPE